MPSSRGRARAVAVAARLRALLREHDLPLAAAGLTFYGALGVVPLVLVSGRCASALVGAARVRDTGAAAARYLPDGLTVADGSRRLAAAAAGLGWEGLLLALVVVSLAAEGLARSLSRLYPAPRRPAWRARLLALPLCVLGIVTAVLAAVGARPLLDTSFGTGWGARLFGGWLAFVIGWAWASAALTVLYRSFPAQTLPWRSVAAGAGAAGSWVVGQALGYVFVLRGVGSGVSAAFGGLSTAGTVAALLFLLYLENLVVLAGYALATALSLTRRQPHRGR